LERDLKKKTKVLFTNSSFNFPPILTLNVKKVIKLTVRFGK